MQKQEISLVLPPEGLVRLPVVIGVLGIGKTTWWCGIKKGRFPQPVKLASRFQNPVCQRRRRLSKEKGAKVLRWLLGIRLLAFNHSPREIALQLNVSDRMV